MAEALIATATGIAEEVSTAAEAALRLTHRQDHGAQQAVVINADQVIEHGRVVALMDAVRQVGVTRIAIAVKPQVGQ